MDAYQHSWPDDPRTVGARCDSCPFASESGGPPHRPVWGVGPLKPVGVIVGENPGADEAETGVPFCGPTGRALDIELLEAGLAREKLFVCNAVLCFPGDAKTSRRLKSAIKCCAKAFAYQMRSKKKLPTLAMGRGAALAVLGKDVNLLKGRGFLRDV